MIPVVREIFCVLGKIDLLALLALTETCSTLYRYILEQVLTSGMLCGYIRQNYYVFYHDIFESLFTNQEILLLHRAFEVLRKRKAIVYEDSISVLGALLARTPLRTLEKKQTLRAKPWNPKVLLYDRSSQDQIPINDRRTTYSCLSEIPWLQLPSVKHLADTLHFYLPCRYRKLERSSKRYLKEDFLFCKQYMDDVAHCYLGATVFQYFVIGDLDLTCFHDFEEADMMFMTILRGMRGSRLREVFDFAIPCALENCGYNKWRSIARDLESSEKYYNETLLPSGEEYQLWKRRDETIINSSISDIES